MIHNRFFNEYPHTDFHELDLSWILDQIRANEHLIADYVKNNSIHYADPIAWNIAAQYPANTVVIDPTDGTAYISVQPVPKGITLDNADYWTAIFNYDDGAIVALTERVDDAEMRIDALEALENNMFTKGKHIVVLGDSNANIFQNSGALERMCPGATFDKLAVDAAGFRFTNNSPLKQLENITKTPDIIILWCGGNDVGNKTLSGFPEFYGVPDVDSNDGTITLDITKTFDACKKTLFEIRNRYPACRIVSVLIDKRDNNLFSDRRTLTNYVFHFLNEIYKKYSVPVIYFGDKSNISRFIYASLNENFQSDQIHYKDVAMNYLANMVINTAAAGMNTDADIPYTFFYYPNNLTDPHDIAAWFINHCYDHEQVYGATTFKHYSINRPQDTQYYGSVMKVTQYRYLLHEPLKEHYELCATNGRDIMIGGNVLVVPEGSTLALSSLTASGTYIVGSGNSSRTTGTPSEMRTDVGYVFTVNHFASGNALCYLQDYDLHMWIGQKTNNNITWSKVK